MLVKLLVIVFVNPTLCPPKTVGICPHPRNSWHALRLFFLYGSVLIPIRFYGRHHVLTVMSLQSAEYLQCIISYVRYVLVAFIEYLEITLSYIHVSDTNAVALYKHLGCIPYRIRHLMIKSRDVSISRELLFLQPTHLNLGGRSATVWQISMWYIYN